MSPGLMCSHFHFLKQVGVCSCDCFSKGTVPQDEISNDSHPLWGKSSLPVADEEFNLFWSSQFLKSNLWKEFLQLLRLNDSVYFGDFIQSVADKFMFSLFLGWSLL